MSAEVEKHLRRTATERLSQIISEWNISPAVAKVVEPKLKDLLKLTISVGCVSACWENKSPRPIFLSQIPENILLAAIFSLKGHLNAAHVALRQSVELFLKHIYFIHHPVEYGWVERDCNVREFTFTFLNEYLSRLDELNDYSDKKEAFTALSSCFAESSRFVHVHSSDFFSGAMGKSEREIVDSFDKLKASIERIVPYLVIIVIMYEYDIFISCGIAERKIIRHCLTKKMRIGFDEWQRSRSVAASR
jgi:hypothetical protein